MKQAKSEKMENVELNGEESSIRIKFFCIRTNKSDEFIGKLEELCREYCIQDDFFFNYSVE